MTSNLYGAGEGTLARAADLVASAHQDLDAMGATLTTRIEGLQGRWQGAGGQAFFALHAAWTQRQRAVTSALADFEQSLRSTQRDNQATDADRAGHFAGFRQRLG